MYQRRVTINAKTRYISSKTAHLGGFAVVEVRRIELLYVSLWSL